MTRPLPNHGRTLQDQQQDLGYLLRVLKVILSTTTITVVVIAALRLEQSIGYQHPHQRFRLMQVL
jgi:hypothetical protein